jgi:hypothetical protein
MAAAVQPIGQSRAGNARAIDGNLHGPFLLFSAYLLAAHGLTRSDAARAGFCNDFAQSRRPFFLKIS